MDQYSFFSPLTHNPPSASDSSSLRSSPPLSPTSQLQYNFNLSFHPDPKEDCTKSQCANHPPSTVLRGRSSQTETVLRRRPSAIDMALREERSRCNGDSIERKGLDLMEPRPVDVNAISNPSTISNSHMHQRHSITNLRGEATTVIGGTDSGRVEQPKFVLGGIFEVMEGRA